MNITQAWTGLSQDVECAGLSWGSGCAGKGHMEVLKMLARWGVSRLEEGPSLLEVNLVQVKRS